MDIVYARLNRRPTVSAVSTSEVDDVLGALWAHATPEDGLEHAAGLAVGDHVDLLMYLLTLNPATPGARSVTHRASSLLHRCHAASPLMQRRYLPPASLA